MTDLTKKTAGHKEIKPLGARVGDWTDSKGQRRFTHQPKMDGDIKIGDVVEVKFLTKQSGTIDHFVVTGFGEEYGEGACKAYGYIVFKDTVEGFREELGDEDIPPEMEGAIEANLADMGFNSREIKAVMEELR